MTLGREIAFSLIPSAFSSNPIPRVWSQVPLSRVLEVGFHVLEGWGVVLRQYSSTPTVMEPSSHLPHNHNDTRSHPTACHSSRLSRHRIQGSNHGQAECPRFPGLRVLKVVPNVHPTTPLRTILILDTNHNEPMSLLGNHLSQLCDDAPTATQRISGPAENPHLVLG